MSKVNNRSLDWNGSEKLTKEMMVTYNQLRLHRLWSIYESSSSDLRLEIRSTKLTEVHRAKSLKEAFFSNHLIINQHRWSLSKKSLRRANLISNCIPFLNQINIRKMKIKIKIKINFKLNDTFYRFWYQTNFIYLLN